MDIERAGIPSPARTSDNDHVLSAVNCLLRTRQHDFQFRSLETCRYVNKRGHAQPGFTQRPEIVNEQSASSYGGKVTRGSIDVCLVEHASITT